MNGELKSIVYKGHRYWYEHRLAKNNVDICLGTKDPEKYCNGFFLYSDKDPGSGKEFVVVKTDNPDPHWAKNGGKPLKFAHIKEGDVVTRMLGGEGGVPMQLIVGHVDAEMIYIGKPDDGGWKFRRENGAEVDEDLGWDGIKTTGSILRL